MSDNVSYTLIQTMHGLTRMCRAIAVNKDPIFYDIETTGLNPHHDRVHIIVLRNDNITYAIDCHALGTEAVYSTIAPLLETTRRVIIAHNLSFDWKFAYHYDVVIKNGHCTMVTERLLSAGLLRPEGFSLKALTNRYLGIPLSKDVRSEFINNPFLDLQDRHFAYACGDVEYLDHIYHAQLRQVQEHDLERVYRLECSLIPVVGVMEYYGTGLDVEGLRSLIAPFTDISKQAYRALQKLFITHGAANHIHFDKDGYTAINLNSKPQMYEALAALGVNPVDKKGNPSLNAKSVLRWDAKHSDGKAYDYAEFLGLDDEDNLTNALIAFDGLKHPLLRAYAFYVAADKLLNSYVIGTLKKYDPITRRVYGWFNQVGARSTGRFSSDMQQIPKDKKLERLSIPYSIRGQFIPAPNHKLLIADYSGIELVILADVSGDEVLGDIVVKNATGEDDLHLYVVRQAFTHLHPQAKDATRDKKDKKGKYPQPFAALREASKPTSYGIAYGITAIALAETISKELAPLGISCSTKEAQEILDGWKYKAFAKAGTWLDKTGKQAVTQGYVTTALGRRRWFDLEFAVLNPWRRHAIEREGCNAPIQGTCADMMKIAMVLFYENIEAYKARIVLTVHDELVVEAHEDHIDEARHTMKWAMETAAQRVLTRMGDYVKIDVSVSDRYDK